MAAIKKDETKQKLVEMEQNWKRALADYQNLVKRTQEQQSIIRSYACLSLLERLLPVLDHLQLAAKHVDDAGLNMVVNQFTEALEAEGVVKIKALNQQFDPNMMECIEKVEGKENLVVEVVSDGYMSGDRVVRVAKVKVGSLLNAKQENN